MGRRAGSAHLPFYGGHVPAWLAQRMARLDAVIVEAIVLEYGRDELLLFDMATWHLLSNRP